MHVNDWYDSDGHSEQVPATIHTNSSVACEDQVNAQGSGHLVQLFRKLCLRKLTNFICSNPML